MPIFRFIIICILTLIINFQFSILGFSQDQNDCDEIIISDSLFLLKSAPFSYFYYEKRREVDPIHHKEDLNENFNINQVFIIENNCIKMRLYSGCSPIEQKLVTNGIQYYDKDGHNFYLIKIYNNDISYTLKMSCIKYLQFDLSKLKYSSGARYLKFQDFDQLIMVPHVTIDSVYMYNYYDCIGDSSNLNFFKWKKNNASNKIAFSNEEVRNFFDVLSNSKIKKDENKVFNNCKVFQFVVDEKRYDMLYSGNWFINLTTYENKLYWIRKKDIIWLEKLLNTNFNKK